MQIIKKETNFDFIGTARFWISISCVVIIASIASFFIKGFNYGIDFMGGTAINIKFKKEAGADANKLREALKGIGMGAASVQNYGEKESGEFLIKTSQASSDIEAQEDTLKKAISEKIGSDNKVSEIKFAPDKMYVRLDKLTEPERIKEAILGLKIKDLKLVSVDPFGKESDREYLANFSGTAQMVNDAMLTTFKQGDFDILKVDKVGRKVGKELKTNAILASFLALFFMLIYIWLRFELEFAPGAVICLIHDTLITAGVFSIFGLEVDTTFVAAILTIVGFSINDTIVIYDRIRENMGLMKAENFRIIVNRSINQTLSRTILTSLTVLFVTLAILIYGGPILFNMALALTIGIFVGSYSTIFIASPITIYLTERFFSKNR